MTNTLIGRVRFVQQPTRSTCGQTCVAMLTGESVFEVCEGIGNHGPTTWFEVCLALRGAGIEARERNVRRLDEFEGFAPLALVSCNSYDMKRGHFALWVGDAFLCPSAGEREPSEMIDMWNADGMSVIELLPLELQTSADGGRP